MILDFSKYKLKVPDRAPDPVLIYPGLQLHVRMFRDKVHIMGLPGDDAINLDLLTSSEAKRLMIDIDMFLQYKTRELPEYLL